ncbi:MAG: divergent PAP2 family protein [Candidatus Omnitrophica bacterium]|nr:divergent PAP2 family protein [Candidatus Omnitrophota bacterium]
MIAQCIKVFLGIIREKKFNFKWFVGTGGMPSSHAAGVSALATSVGFTTGFDSLIFAVTLIFALITMFDAQGVRRASGMQAEVLNKILDDIYFNRGIKEERVKELLGHTPIQVLIGACIGFGIAVTFYSQ